MNLNNVVGDADHVVFPLPNLPSFLFPHEQNQSDQAHLAFYHKLIKV